MNILLAGAGKIGLTLAQALTREGHSVTVIDKDPDRIAVVNAEMDVMTVCGSVDIDLLKLAGAETADLLIAATDSDEANILCCMVGRKLGAKHTIARVRQEEHYREVILLREELGLSLTINPESAAAAEISRVLRFPSAAKVEAFAKGQAELVELRLTEANLLCGMAVRSYHSRFGTGTLLCAVRRGENVYIPDGSFVLQAGDSVSIAGAPQNIHSFFRSLGILKKGAKFVLVVGGSRVSVYLARQLLAMGLKVKLLEQDPARCEAIKDLLPKAEVVCCDGSHPDVLEEEGMPAFDALAALTDEDELNLIIAAYAARSGLEKVVYKVNESHFAGLAAGFRLEDPVLPRDIVAQQVLQYVRSMDNSTGGLESLLRVMDGRLEVLEFRAPDRSPCVGRTLRDMPIRSGVLVAAIIREGKCLIPGGDDSICPGDSVLAVTTIRGMTALEDILKG